MKFKMTTKLITLAFNLVLLASTVHAQAQSSAPKDSHAWIGTAVVNTRFGNFELASFGWAPTGLYLSKVLGDRESHAILDTEYDAQLIMMKRLLRP